MLKAACGCRSPLARRLVAAVRGHRAPVRRHQDPPLAPPQQQLPQAVEGRSSDREHVGRLRRAVNQVPGPAAPRQAPLLGEGLWRFWGDARGRETKSGGAKGTHAPGVVQKRDSEAVVPGSAQRGADQRWGDPAHAKLGAASCAGNAPGGPASVAAPMVVASRRAGWAEGRGGPRCSLRKKPPAFVHPRATDEGCGPALRTEPLIPLLPASGTGSPLAAITAGGPAHQAGHMHGWCSRPQQDLWTAPCGLQVLARLATTWVRRTCWSRGGAGLGGAAGRAGLLVGSMMQALQPGGKAATSLAWTCTQLACAEMR